MRTNIKSVKRTHEGAPAAHLTLEQQLRRSVLACMLFEDEFYEDGVTISERIKSLVHSVPFEEAAKIAVEARSKMKLRHVSLLIVRELLRHPKRPRSHTMGELVYNVIQRPDEMGELLALYWKDGKEQPLPAQLKIGLARALKKFNEYELAKWDKEGSVRLRDVLFLVHPKPYDAEQQALFDKIANKTLATPETWEVMLSGGGDKHEVFEKLLRERKLGALALLRNLRNMTQACVDTALIEQAIQNMKVERVLPFRFLTAANYAPHLEHLLEAAMFKCLENHDKLDGKTALVVDHSGSMVGTKVSERSELDRFDAACALAMLVKEVSDCRVFAFSSTCWEIGSSLRGFGLRAGLKQGPFGSTYLGKAVQYVMREAPDIERLIVITDEQSYDVVQLPKNVKGYMINVASAQNGVGFGDWVRITGWSEAIVDYITTYETALPVTNQS